MKIFRRIAAAFLMYSRIPVPHFEMKKEDMAESLDFFPLVGALIGLCVVFINCPFMQGFIKPAVRIILTVLLPILITGGFHIDGFMDTKDALSSMSSREKKLEIMKDPHIGAFAVIAVIKQQLIFAAAVCTIVLNEKTDMKIYVVLGLIFVVSRCLAAFTSLLFTKAKKDGMLVEETGGSRKITLSFLSVWLILACMAMIFTDPFSGGALTLSFILVTVYYRNKTLKEFGGVTGDTAGYFLILSETVAAAALAVSGYFPL